MKIICITQRPIQTLILIYLLAKKNIFFEKVIYCNLKNKNFRDEGAISWKALEKWGQKTRNQFNSAIA